MLQSYSTIPTTELYGTLPNYATWEGNTNTCRNPWNNTKGKGPRERSPQMSDHRRKIKKGKQRIGGGKTPLSPTNENLPAHVLRGLECYEQVLIRLHGLGLVLYALGIVQNGVC